MSIERENLHSQTATLLIEIQEGEKTVYRPLLVNKTANNITTRYILEEKERLEERLKELRIIPTQRCKREIRDIRKNRETIINKEQLKEKLSILSGERLQPIRLIPKRGKITGFEISNFAEERQERWWTYVERKDLMGKIAEIAEAYPKGPEILFDLFEIRQKMKHGSLEEANRAREELDSFNLKTRDIPLKYDILFVPLFKMITEEFGN